MIINNIGYILGHYVKQNINLALITSNQNENILTKIGFMYVFNKLSSDGLKNFRRCKYKREFIPKSMA